MRKIHPFHHFRTETEIDDRVARCERFLVQRILESTVRDTERENSKAWELKHHASCVQFARLIARSRGMPEDVCAVGLLLHDIYAIDTGKYHDHARKGVPIASDIAANVGKFSDIEISLISKIVGDHSDKHLYSDDIFSEFGKDIDTLDCLLHPESLDYYVYEKPVSKLIHYLRRGRRMNACLGVPSDRRFRILEGLEASGASLATLALPLQQSTVEFESWFQDSDLSFVLAFELAGRWWLSSIGSEFDELLDVVRRETSGGVELNPPAGACTQLLVLWPCIDRVEVTRTGPAADKRLRDFASFAEYLA